MRILISAGWLGGAGGAERALYSILRALGGHDVDVVVRQRLGGPLAEIGDGAKYEEPTVDPFYREPSTIRRPPKKPLYVPRSELPGFGVSSKSKQKPTRRGF